MADIPNENVYYNYLDFKGDHKIEIEYTRSHLDYLRACLYFVIRVLLILLLIVVVLKFLGLYDHLISILN